MRRDTPWSTAVAVVGELSLAVADASGVADCFARALDFFGWGASVDELLRWRACLGGCLWFWSVADGLALSITKRGLSRYINVYNPRLQRVGRPNRRSGFEQGN